MLSRTIISSIYLIIMNIVYKYVTHFLGDLQVAYFILLSLVLLNST